MDLHEKFAALSAKVNEVRFTWASLDHRMLPKVFRPRLLEPLRVRHPFRNITPTRLYSNTVSMSGLSTAWRKQSPTEQEEEIATLVASSQSLKHTLRKLQAVVGVRNSATTAEFMDLEGQVEKVDEIARKMAESRFFNYQHGSGGGVTAERFFDVPEITERVLLRLDIADILAMQQVNKRSFSIVKGSKKLQRKMHILPEHDGGFRPLELRPCGWREEWIHPALHNLEIALSEPGRSLTYGPGLDHATITVKLAAADYAYPPASRIANMLICQPPITALDVTVKCCTDTSRGQEHYWEYACDSPDQYEEGKRIEYFEAHGRRLEKVQNEQGITVGDVLEVCNRVSMQHSLCSHASRETHDLDGWVWPSFQLDGILPPNIALSRGHRSLASRGGLRVRSSGAGFGGKGDQSRETMLWNYMNVKKGGKSSPKNPEGRMQGDPPSGSVLTIVL